MKIISQSLVSASLFLFCLTACSGNNTTDTPTLDDPPSSEPSEPEQPASPNTTPAQIFEHAVGNGFSGVALLRHRGETLLHEAAGFANKDQSVPNETDTVFDMGSITKSFTGALTLSLQESGLLNVTDTLSQYFDDVPADKANISIHQLLTHTAGFPSALGFDSEPIGRDAFLSRAFSSSLRFEPGTAFLYSNVGFSVAAAIAEKVSGQAYENLLSERVLVPAAIDATGYLLPAWSSRTVALGYNGNNSFDSQSIWGDDGPYWHLLGNGGLLTTSSDLLKWHDALAGEAILSTSSIEVLQGQLVDLALDIEDPTPPGEEFYGYGWSVFDSPIGAGIAHSGGNGFQLAMLARFPEEDLVAIVLSNDLNEDVFFDLLIDLLIAAAPELEGWF